jgi:hypothetical protein
MTTAAAALVAASVAAAQTGRMEVNPGPSSGARQEPGATRSQDRGGLQGSGAQRSGEIRDQSKDRVGRDRQERTGETREQPKDRIGRDRQERSGETRDQSKSKDRIGTGQARDRQRDQQHERVGETPEQRDRTTRSRGEQERSGETRDRQDRIEGRTDRDAIRSVQLSQEQRTRIHETIVRRRDARVEHPDFRVSVGTRIPRTVHVFAIPEDMVTIVPQFVGFKYIVVGDELVILDPDTLEIVAVVPV